MVLEILIENKPIFNIAIFEKLTYYLVSFQKPKKNLKR